MRYLNHHRANLIVIFIIDWFQDSSHRQITSVLLLFFHNFIKSVLFDGLIRRFTVKTDDSVLTVFKVTKHFHGHSPNFEIPINFPIQLSYHKVMSFIFSPLSNYT